MNEQPQAEHKSPNIVAIASLVIALVVAGAVALLAFRVEDLTKKVAFLTANEDAANKQKADTVTYDLVESGKGGFTMNLPSGWGPLIKTTNSDDFILVGQMQPTVAAGAETIVTEMEGYGSDNASIFSVSLSKEKSAYEPLQGAVEEDFEIGKGDEMLKGKKYSYIYTEDTLVGIGYLRPQNDRDYAYIFTTADGKELAVAYSVYGSDPRNHVAIVDEIVRSIVVK